MRCGGRLNRNKKSSSGIGFRNYIGFRNSKGGLADILLNRYIGWSETDIAREVAMILYLVDLRDHQIRYGEVGEWLKPAVWRSRHGYFVTD